MDNYLDRERWKNYYLAMAQPYANSLKSTADFLSFIHLKDGFIQMAFQDDVKRFVDAKLEIIRNPQSSDEERNQSVQEMQQELEYLNIQDRMLRSGEAALHASVTLYHENEKIIGYIIDGIGIVLSGVQVVVGINFVLRGGVLGVFAGANMIVNGLSSMVEGYQKIKGEKYPENFMRNAYMDTAEFMGFKRETGYLAFQGVDTATSFYGMFSLTLKPDAWRLFRYIPSDFYRKVEYMGKGALTIKMSSGMWKGVQTGAALHEMEKREN